MEVAAEAAAKSTTFVLWYGTIINNLNNLLKVIIQLDCARWSVLDLEMSKKTSIVYNWRK